jgi:glyoxylase-like metal-dependent hydrolase (beta-lactamase superfamily II)
VARAPVPEAIDLLHGGCPQVICCWRVGEVLVDPGPASCLPTLLGSLRRATPAVIALTHIHLDHAGAAGSLARLYPDAEVWVHERGAPHLVDPSRLLASAGRLYGERMQALWGEVLPVPAERIRHLRGGEELEGFRVAYTPGHASHHVAYLHEASRHAFTGDVAGVRIAEGPVLPPTPPPDINLRAWERSIVQLESWAPAHLGLTHFGGFAEPASHLQQLRQRLRWVAKLAAESDEATFGAAIERLLRESTRPATAAAYAQAMPPDQSFQGLSRHLAGG